MADGPHAYRSHCGCEECTQMRAVFERCAFQRAVEDILGHPDWSGRATAKLLPGHALA